MEKKIIPGILSVVVVVTLLVSLLIPTLSLGDDREELYIFGIFGQSNGAYYFEDLDAVNVEIEPISAGKAFYFGTPERPIRYAEDPLSCDIYDMCPDGTWTIGNLEPSFAKEIVDSGKSVLIINFAIPSFVMSQLMPGGEAWGWETAVISAALNSVDKATFKPIVAGVLSVHGEGDTGGSVAVYKQRYIETMNALSRSYGFNCSIMSYVRDLNGSSNSLKAEKELVAEYPNVILGCSATLGFTEENGLLRSDGVHYTQAGDNIIGADCANAWLDSEFADSGNSWGFDSFSALWVVVPLILFATVLGIYGLVRSKY